MQQITVLITDDHKLIRETWRMVLNSDPSLKVIAECGSGEEAIEKATTLRPDIVIMDVNLPGMNGIETIRQIRKYSPGSRILGISMHRQPEYARKMMRAGAMGYLTKNSSKEELFLAIKDIAAGRKYICEEIKNILSARILQQEETGNGHDMLSWREIEVIGEIKKGFSSKEISAVLNISVKTVEVHRHNILKKLKMKNVASLVNFINRQPEFGFSQC